MTPSASSVCRVVLLSIMALNCLAADPFTIVVIGDQQRPVEDVNFYTSFTAQTDWIAANAGAKNIRFVTQVGDIVEHGNDTAQYARALAAMETLDSASNADGGTGIPWSVAYGNHEANLGAPGNDPAGADADIYRQYFGTVNSNHRYAAQPQYRGVSTNDLNTYHVIRSSSSYGSREYLMLNLEYDVPGHAPGTNPATSDLPAFDAIAWAQGIIDAHPNMPTVITTHVFEGTIFGPPDYPYTSGPGRNSQVQIFDKLVKNNPQVFMVFSGHTGQDSHQVKTNAYGLKVLQVVTDYNKVRPNGGNGFFRLVELDEAAGEIRVRTYTPGVPQNPTPRYDTSANGQFTITLDWATRFQGPRMSNPQVIEASEEGATVRSQLDNESADDVTLVWSPVDLGESSVETWTSAAGGGSHSFGLTSVDTVLSHSLTGLPSDRRYYFRFVARSGAESAWSAAGTFSTGLKASPPPAGLVTQAGTTQTGTKVELTWTDHFATETGFLIQRSVDPGFATITGYQVGADETSFTDDTTEPNTTYYYRIGATGSTGTGAFSAHSHATTSEHPEGTPTARLIAHWKFDEGSGITAADSSGNNLTVTGSDSWTPGVSGSAANNPKFSLPNSSSLAFTGTKAFSISLWAKPSTNDDFAILAGFEGTGTEGDRFGIKISAGKLQVTSGGAISTDTIENFSGANDAWVHIVGVNDPKANGGAGASYLYINGIENQYGALIDIPNPATAKWTMGTYWNSGLYDYSGALDDVQVYDGALTATDVAFLRSNPGRPLITNPISLFKDWATDHITDIDPTTDATFGGNPDGDPFTNGLEWALGGDPLAFDTLASLLDHKADSTVGLTFAFRREDTSEGEVDLALEFSSDLFDVDVNLSTIPPVSGATGGVNYTITENGDAPDDVTATVTAGNAGGGKLFGRLKAIEK